MTSPKPPIFICYAHDDNDSNSPERRRLDRLSQQLQPHIYQGDFSVFSDKNIEVGDEWDETIQDQLKKAQAAVVLASPALLASAYVRNHELPVLLTRRKEEGLKVLLLIVSPCRIEHAIFKYPDPQTGPHEFTLGSLQAFNSPDNTLLEMDEATADRTLMKVADRLLEIVGNP